MSQCCVCCKCYDGRMCGDSDEHCSGIGALLVQCKRFMMRSFENIFVAMDGTRKYLNINKLSTLSVGW